MVSKKSKDPIGLITELFTDASRDFKEKFLVLVFEALRDLNEKQKLGFNPEALPEDFSLRNFIDLSEWTSAMLYEAVEDRKLVDVINILFSLVQLAERLEIRELCIEPGVGKSSGQDEGDDFSGGDSRSGKAESRRESIFRLLEEKIGAPLTAKKIDSYFVNKGTSPALLAMELGPGISAQDIEGITLELRAATKRPGAGEKTPSVPKMLKQKLGEEHDSLSVEDLRDKAGGNQQLADQLNAEFGGKASSKNIASYLSFLRSREKRRGGKKEDNKPPKAGEPETTSGPESQDSASPEILNRIKDTEVPE